MTSKGRLWRWFLVPGTLSVLYFPTVLVLAVLFLDDLIRHVHERWLPQTLQSTVTVVLLSLALSVLTFSLAFIAFRSVVMILYSPVLGFLSESVERLEFGTPPPEFNWRNAAYDTYRGIVVALATLAFSLTGMVLCWLLVLIPVVGGPLSVVAQPLVQMFFAGVGFCDPALGRRRTALGASLKFFWRHRWRIVGHGCGFVVLLCIPILGWFLAPGYGIMAGTLGAAELLSHDPEEETPGRRTMSD